MRSPVTTRFRPQSTARRDRGYWRCVSARRERIVLLEETGAQLKDESAILKGEKPRPQINPSTLNKDTPAGEGPPRRDRGDNHDKQPKELEIHETRILEPPQMPAGAVFKG